MMNAEPAVKAQDDDNGSSTASVRVSTLVGSEQDIVAEADDDAQKHHGDIAGDGRDLLAALFAAVLSHALKRREWRLAEAA